MAVIEMGIQAEITFEYFNWFYRRENSNWLI